MRIGLISDTHIPDRTRELPSQLEQVFSGVDLILHGGDIYIPSVLEELELLAPVLAAEGDDEYPGMSKDSRVKKKHVLNIEGTTIWLMHKKPWPLDSNELPDVIVFGHTHYAAVEKKGDVLLVNPGSPTFYNYKHQTGTVALLTVSSGKTEVDVVQL